MRTIFGLAILIGLSACNQNITPSGRSSAEAAKQAREAGDDTNQTNDDPFGNLSQHKDNTKAEEVGDGPGAEAFKVSRDAYFQQVGAYADLDPRGYNVLYFVAKDSDNVDAGADTYMTYGEDLKLTVEQAGIDGSEENFEDFPDIDFPDYKMWSTTDGVKYGTMKLLDKDSRGVSASKLYTAFYVKDEKMYFLRQKGNQKNAEGFVEHNWENLAEATPVAGTDGTVMYGFRQDRAADDLELITLQRSGVWARTFDQEKYLEDGTIQFQDAVKLNDFTATDLSTLYQRQAKQNLNNKVLIMSYHPDDIELADEMLAEDEAAAGLALAGIPTSGAGACRFWVQVGLTVVVMSYLFRRIGVKFFRKKALRHPYITSGAIAGATAGLFVGFAAASTSAEKDSDDLSAMNILGQTANVLCNETFWYGLGDVLKTLTNEVLAPAFGSERGIFLDGATMRREDDDLMYRPEPVK